MTEGIVSFNEWTKLDLRVGKITKVENVENADKLYKLTIDLGKEIGKRIIVAGIKPYYKLEELKNKLCVIFTNLQPRSLKGIESQGMLLASVSSDEKKVHLLQPDKDIELGSKVR